MLGVTFIGGGNMAQALINGLIVSGSYSKEQISVVEIDSEIRQHLQMRWGIVAQAELSTCHELIVLAVKPQVVPQALAQLGKYWSQNLAQVNATAIKERIVLSIAAGITTAHLLKFLNTVDAPQLVPKFAPQLVRAMPNTPALIGQGMSGLFADAGVSQAARARVEQLMNAVGVSVWLDDEDDLNSVTALSGSGPAYVFYFLEAMQQAGIAQGLPPALARQLAQTTFQGASQLAAQSTESLSELRQRVTSKGGTTAAALAVMDETKIAAHFVAAIHAAKQRSIELGR